MATRGLQGTLTGTIAAGCRWGNCLERTTTTTAAKAWGGKLQSVRTREERPPILDVAGWLGLFFRRFAELCLLAAVVAVPGLYQLSLTPEAFNTVREAIGNDLFFMTQIQPYLSGMVPVLEAKFTVWFVLGMMMMSGYGAGRILEALCGRAVFLPALPGEDSSRAKRHRLIPLVAIGVYLGYSLLSFLLWAPEMPAEAAEKLGRSLPTAGSPETAADWLALNLGGGGFFFSLTAWLQVTFALFFFLVAEDMMRGRQFVYRILGLLILMGIVNALLVVLLKVQFGPLMNIWIRFSEDDTRNQLGALIGHNTGVSSFLMAPLFVAATWLLAVQPREARWQRPVLAGVVVLIMLALLLAQSRAVLPIILVLGAGLGVLLYRRSCVRRRSRLYVWMPVALVFVLLTQLVPMRHNPLYRQDITLPERVTEFTPQRLLTETRLRIATVSFSELIPGRPFHGHGFGTFQYVYPEAQGNYFMENQRSRLAPTDRRTMRAHNEYLQAVIETGVVGLVIALIGLGAVLLHGWRTMKRTLMPHHVATQAAIWFSALAILLHAFVDFPLRVPPIALTMVLLLAMISAADRLWVFPVKAPTPEEEIEATREREEKEGVRGGMAGFVAPVLAVVAFLLLLGAVGAAFVAGANRFVTTATLQQRGEAYLRGYYAAPQRDDLLFGAWEDLREAKRTFWISGPVNRLNAQLQYFQAQRFFDFGQQDMDAGNEEMANANFGYAVATANAGISDLDMALAEEKFNQMYHVRSSLYGVLAQFSTGEERQRYARRSFEDMRRGVYMNPGDYQALAAYIVRLQDRPGSEEREIVELMGMLDHFDPAVFEERILSRARDAIALAQPSEALRLLPPILQVRPADPHVRGLHAMALRRSGQRAQAERVVTAMIERPGPLAPTRAARDSVRLLRLELAVARGDTAAARRLLEGVPPETTVPEAHLATLRYYLAVMDDPESPEAAGLRARILTLGRRDPIHLQIAGTVLYTALDDPEAAVEWFERRRAASPPHPPMDLPGLVLLAKVYAELERWDDLEEVLPELHTTAGTAHARTLARQIARRLERRMEEAREGEAES